MHITSISPSSYSQYDDCKMKYFISNVLKIREPAGDAALKGTMVHYFFEILGKIKKANQEGLTEIEIPNFKTYQTNIPTDAEIPSLFDEIFTHFCNTQKLDKKYHKECYDHVLAVIGSEEDVRNLWVVDTEKRFSIELPFDWAKYDIATEEGRDTGYIAVNGIIDLVVKKPDGSMQVIDWKSGRRKDWITGKLKDEEYLKNDIQLKIYDAAIRLLYPEIPDIRICIFFTKDGGPFYPILDKNSADDTWKKIKNRVTEIRGNELPVQNRTFRCKFCYYSKIKFNDAPKEYRRFQLDEIGQKMCACSQLSIMVHDQNTASLAEKYKYGKTIEDDSKR